MDWRVEEEDEDQIARHEQQQKQHHDEEEDEGEERRRRRVELTRPSIPEPMALGMSHLPLEDHDEPCCWSGPIPSAVLDQLLERLTTLSNQLESAVALSSNLQAQHATAQNTMSAPESKVTPLEDLVRSSQIQPPSPPPIEIMPDSITAPHPSELLTQMLNDWKQFVEGQWSPVPEEWASEREHLAAASDEWESKVKSVETNLGMAAAEFDAGLASLAVLQRQQQLGLGNGVPWERARWAGYTAQSIQSECRFR